LLWSRNSRTQLAIPLGGVVSAPSPPMPPAFATALASWRGRHRPSAPAISVPAARSTGRTWRRAAARRDSVNWRSVEPRLSSPSPARACNSCRREKSANSPVRPALPNRGSDKGCSVTGRRGIDPRSRRICSGIPSGGFGSPRRRMSWCHGRTPGSSPCSSCCTPPAGCGMRSGAVYGVAQVRLAQLRAALLVGCGHRCRSTPQSADAHPRTGANAKRQFNILSSGASGEADAFLPVKNRSR
jgi:hypothetical protein